MLVSAAAQRWNVDPASCPAQSGEVLHPPTGRRVKYGDLAADAARLAVPESVALNRPQDFKLIGTPAKRLDAPTKVNGRAIYGIDVRPPGVKIATLVQSPVFGGRVKSVDGSSISTAVVSPLQDGGVAAPQSRAAAASHSATKDHTRSGPSSSMLSCGPTTPQDYRE
jgi:CO/xanthine dehydrogenase Mo-binding subunit